MTRTQRIQLREIPFGLIGHENVGLSLAVDFATAGFKVIGIDVDQEKVNNINAGKNYIKDVDDSELQKVVEDGRCHATTDYASLKKPTPFPYVYQHR